jgi:hypothetical protein
MEGRINERKPLFISNRGIQIRKGANNGGNEKGDANKNKNRDFKQANKH